MFLLDRKIELLQKNIVELKYFLNDNSPTGRAKRELFQDDINENELIKLETKLEFLLQDRDSNVNKLWIAVLSAIPAFILGIVSTFIIKLLL